MSELKACPFCGSKKVWLREFTYTMGAKDWNGECERCYARTPNTISRAKAIEAWNTRAEPEPSREALVAENEKLWAFVNKAVMADHVERVFREAENLGLARVGPDGHGFQLTRTLTDDAVEREKEQ